MSKASATGKSKKKGRNSPLCQRYRSDQRGEKNKAIKLARHLKKYGNTSDKSAVTALKALPAHLVKDVLKNYRIPGILE